MHEVAKLTASDATGGERFGRCVAMSGDTVVVGAQVDNDAGPVSGSAYAFVRAGGVWAQQAKLTASDAATGDNFGRSVAICGDTAVIGAPLDTHAGGTWAGSAYVFVRSGTVWTQQAKLTASDAAAGDQFGISVAVSGETAIVGAWEDDDAGSSSGSAYVFVRSGTVWTQQAKLTASDATAGDEFGWSVALSGDTAVVGAYLQSNLAGTYAGAAYVFVRSGTVWTEQAKLSASNAAAGMAFGASVALSADTAIVGDWLNGIGSAYVFVRSGAVWVQQAQLTASDAPAGDWFGLSVAVSGDVAVVGAQHDAAGGTNAGSAYVFVRSGTVWTQQSRLTASDAAANDNFGTWVALSGNTAVVGAQFDDNAGGIDAGSTYVFTLNDIGPGDLDGNGDVDSADTAILVSVLLGLDTDSMHVARADINCSGSADGLDIPPFVDILLN